METVLDDIVKIITRKNLGLRILTLLTCLLVLAFVYNLLLLPTELVPGGVNGIAILTNYLYDIDSSLMIFLISGICLLFSAMFLGKEKTIVSLAATFIYPLFVKLTSLITPNITIDHNDVFLIIIFAGVIGGIANGYIYKTGFSNGGLPIISQILYEHFKIPVTKSSMVINGIIIFLGSFFFGWSMLMYAIILIYINNIMIDKVLLQISSNKAMFIVTEKGKEVKDYIINRLHHKAMILDTPKKIFHKNNQTLFCVIPTRDYYRVTEGIKLIDPNLFYVVEDAYEVKNEDI